MMKFLRRVGLATLAVLVGLGGPIGTVDKGPFAQGQECTVTLSPAESIQEAIDAAEEGAVLCLEEGTWEENLVIEKSLTLRGLGPERSIVDGVEADHPVLFIDSAKEITVRIEGLKLTGAEGNCIDPLICAYGVASRYKGTVEILSSAITDNAQEGIGLSATLGAGSFPSVVVRCRAGKT